MAARRGSRSFFPTFLEDVQRAYDPNKTPLAEWQILSRGETRLLKTRQEIFQYVFMRALQHLRADVPTNVVTPFYPLTEYRLLANAIGQEHIPEALIQNEHRILTILSENKQALAQRREDQAQVNRELEAKKARRAATREKTLEDAGVKNSVELALVEANYSTDMAAKAIDKRILVQSEMPNVNRIEQIRTRLEETHTRQAVSA